MPVRVILQGAQADSGGRLLDNAADAPDQSGRRYPRDHCLYPNTVNPSSEKPKFRPIAVQTIDYRRNYHEKH